ncbi:MAG: Gfo/Idh/MocA family oxidoreductase [Candidatus Omnitrophota bacterium]
MKLNVLIVGAGMYVCGRGTAGYGTVLPSLAEACRLGLVDRISAAATSGASIKILGQKVRGLNRLTGLDLTIPGWPKQGKDAGSYKKIIARERPDCAIVVVPDHLHAHIAADLIKQGIHTFIVKPLAPSMAEAEALVKLLQKNKVYGAVDFHKRFDEANRKLRDVIAGGEIGDPLYFIVEYSQKKIIPEKLFRAWVEKTNIFQYLGVHYADLIYFVTGAKPLRVLATGQRNWLAKKGINTYDSIQVLIEWSMPSTKKKFVSSILTNWIDPQAASSMSDQKIKVIGTQGRYESDQKNRGVQIVTDSAGIEDFNPYFSQFYSDGQGKKVFRGYGERSIRCFLTDVQDIMTGRRTPSQLEGVRPTFKQALVSTAIVDAVNLSLKRNGAWVTI